MASIYDPVRKIYSNFRGVDFTDENVSETRSPDALNMWKNYKTLGKKIETRPDIELQLTMSNTIFGLFFYTISNVDHLIIHSGTSLFDYNPKTKVLTTIKATGMNPAKSVGFVYNNILFIKDGLNYLEYNGSVCKDVEGTIPNVAIHNMNSNSTKMIQEANLITDYCYEEYLPDGTKTEFPLSQKEVSNVTVWDISGVNEVQITTGFTVDTTTGLVTFDKAPEKSADKASIKIKYSKTSDGRNIINKCKLACIFDNRVFFSGNQDYPNMLVWCGLNDPRYVGTSSYATQGTSVSQIKALVPGNNALWVFKEPSQENTTIFYTVPTELYDGKLEQTVKTYASSHSSITTGCQATGINFNDDIVFFSDRGMEGISGSITTEQVLGHRSTLVDRKLLNEENYKNMELVEWEGYLLVIIDNKIYLADSKQKVQNDDHVEYEWFYWEMAKKIKTATVHNDILYLCSEEDFVRNELGYKKYTDGTNIYWYDEANNKVYDNEGNESQLLIETLTAVMQSEIYTLTDTSSNVKSYWTTKLDDFGYPQMLKTTNKRGFKSNVTGDEITIETKLDNNEFQKLGTFKNTKGYIVSKIKKKKWNRIQLRYSSDTQFGIYEIVLESYVGSYVKRS
ncbi:MAG: hypothetical protein MSA15_17515 [Clostridium sp.]|nr:hypothetical protein [Clostridium sp.]